MVMFVYLQVGWHDLLMKYILPLNFNCFSPLRGKLVPVRAETVPVINNNNNNSNRYLETLPIENYITALTKTKNAQ